MNTVPHPGPRKKEPTSAPPAPARDDLASLVQLVSDMAQVIATMGGRLLLLEDFRAKIEKHGCGFYQLARTLAAAPAKAPKAPRPKRKK